MPTRIYFGKGQISHLHELIPQYGTRVLLAYGGGSIKRNGLYDTITSILKEEGVFFCELSGIEPNPRIETVTRGVRMIANRPAANRPMKTGRMPFSKAA